MKGTIAKLTEKGFGFIKVEGEEKDLFFHAKEVKDNGFNSLREGDIVTFEKADGPKGPNAINVEKVEDGAEMQEAA